MARPEENAVLEAVEALPPEKFVKATGGWISEISSALLDAVYSMRQNYGDGENGRGVLARVRAFRERYPEALDSLSSLQNLSEEDIREVMGNTKVPGKNGNHKSVAVLEAASAFCAIGVDTAEDLLKDPAAAKAAYTGVRGLGWITYEYLLMLLGRPGVKADTMIQRFVNTALKQQGLASVGPEAAYELVKYAYENSDAAGDLSLSDFDHSIWRHQRG